MIKLKTRKHRGVSEVITTILLLAITMVGAVFVASIVQNSMLTTTDQTATHSEFIANSIKLTGYDTRDSADLSGIENLDNNFPPSALLCTVSCSGFANNVPIGGSPGTEFIVLQIQNTNLNPIYLSKIYINGIEHDWAPLTTETTLNASFDDPSGDNYPHAGKFRIIPTSNNDPILQRTTNEINGGEEVRIVIKLNQNFPSDIEMWRPLQIHLIHGGPQPTEYIILSGETR